MSIGLTNRDIVKQKILFSHAEEKVLVNERRETCYFCSGHDILMLISLHSEKSFGDKEIQS